LSAYRPDDKPWERKQLTDAYACECDTPNSKPLYDAGLVLHGLRGHACVRLVRTGYNTRQISDIIGVGNRRERVHEAFEPAGERRYCATRREEFRNATAVWRKKPQIKY
jgi:hypothetical protein